MQVKVTSLHARKLIDEEIQNIMRNSEGVQAERDKLIIGVGRNSLDEKRLKEMKEFIGSNNTLEQFDKDLFRRLIHHVVVMTATK